jgi:peptidoglycan/xylan/chitin deacetylase (PgdA/CDA1 family)
VTQRTGRWLLAGLLIAILPATVLALGGGDHRDLTILNEVERALRVGDRGERIAALQELLLDAGYSPGPVDGIFGPLTEAAVRGAQEALALEKDGLAGRHTLAALKEQLRNQIDGAASTAASPQEPIPAGVQLVVHRVNNPVQAAPQAEHLRTEAVPAQQRFGLTFNGTPDPELLPVLLQTLRRHGVQATFFVRGRTAQEQPGALALIVAEGHEIANHGYTDRDLSGLSEAVMTADLKRAQNALTLATGQAPAFFRPPTGVYNQRLVSVANQRGLRLALWTNVLMLDSPDIDPAGFAATLAESIYPRAVVMLHQDRPSSVAALEPLLAELANRGLHSVTLSTLAAEPVDRF